jgi:glycosyltransferase involved in cell wall biosynthesis
MGISTDIMTFNMNEKWSPVWKEETVENGSYKVFRVPALNPFPYGPNPMFNLLRVNVIPKPSFLSKLREYDVLHFIGETDLSLLFLSYFIRKPKLLQCVGIWRDGGIYKYYMHDRAFLGKTFKRIFPRLADRFAISSHQEKALLMDMGVPHEKILDLPIGVDTEIFKPSHIKRSDNLILFVGRIYRVKGLHILIEALRHVQVPIYLAIVGPRWDAKYVKEIEEMSRAINGHGLHKVAFKGSLDQSNLVQWYQRAAIVVCPYLYEDYSNVVRESLACGTPVLSTGTHIVKNGNDGILLTSKNPEEMATAIKELLENKQMREKCGKAGRELVERYFSWESVLEKLERVYRDMLEA